MKYVFYRLHMFITLTIETFFFFSAHSSRSRTMDVSVGVPVHPAKEKPPINVVGDVGGRIAIMVVSCQNQKHIH